MTTMTMQEIERREPQPAARVRLPADAERALVQAPAGLGAVRDEQALRSDGCGGEEGAADRRSPAPYWRSARAAATTWRSFDLTCAGSASSRILSSTTACARAASAWASTSTSGRRPPRRCPSRIGPSTPSSHRWCSARCAIPKRRCARCGACFAPAAVSYSSSTSSPRTGSGLRDRAARGAPSVAGALRRVSPRSRHRPPHRGGRLRGRRPSPLHAAGSDHGTAHRRRGARVTPVRHRLPATGVGGGPSSRSELFAGGQIA